MVTAVCGIGSRDLKLDERREVLPVCEVHMKQVFEMK
jgi:hypothetical protein